VDETVFRKAKFDQSPLLKADRNPSSAGGACHMFALKWISEIEKHKELGTSDRILKMTRGAQEVRMLYKAFTVRWMEAGSSTDMADEGVAKMIGVKVEQPVENPKSATAVAKLVTDHKRLGFVYSFWFAKGGAHSIAFYRSGGTFGGHAYAFEPNFGEYKMPKSRLGDWISWLDSRYAAFGAVTSRKLRLVGLNTQSGLGGR